MLAHIRAHCVLVITRAVSVRGHIGLASAVRVRVGRVLDVHVRPRVSDCVICVCLCLSACVM